MSLVTKTRGKRGPGGVSRAAASPLLYPGPGSRRRHFFPARGWPGLQASRITPGGRPGADAKTPHPTGLPGSFPKARRSESFPPERSVLLLGSAGRLLARSGCRVASRGDLVQLAQGGPARRCFARSRNLVGATSDFLCEILTRVTLPSQRWLTGRPSLVPVVPHHSHQEPVPYPRGRAVPISQGLPRPQNHTGQTLSGAKTATAGRRCQERLIWSTAGPAKGCPGPPSGPPSSTGAPPVLLQRSCPPPPSETPPPPAPALYLLVLCRHEATVHPHEGRDGQPGHCGAPAAVGTRGALLKAGQGEVRPL